MVVEYINSYPFFDKEGPVANIVNVPAINYCKDKGCFCFKTNLIKIDFSSVNK